MIPDVQVKPRRILENARFFAIMVFVILVLFLIWHSIGTRDISSPPDVPRSFSLAG